MPESVDSHFWIVQGIGFISFAIFVFSFQLLNPRHTILTQSPANFVLALHFVGLGSMMAAFISFTAMFRDASNGLCKVRWNALIMVTFLAALCVGTVFFADSWYDYCGVIGSAFVAVAQFFRERFYLYRALCLGHQSLWVVVFFMLASIPGTVFMSCIFASNVIGIVRYLRERGV